MSLNLDQILKIIQSIFYITAALIAVLTYLKAKNGLLNTINTEYHKRVIERLSAVSEELFAEFDSGSESHWLHNNSAKELVERIHENIGPREEVIGSDPGGPIPFTKEEERLHRQVERYQSDPFLPRVVRERVVDFLGARLQCVAEVHREVVENYIAGLCSGKYWDSKNENHNWVNNEIVSRLYERGCGVSQNEEEVHAIRMEIQKYFEKFNPLGN
ncbi:hypothetical protein [Paraburkholderia aromaticivorans]|uniref:hypothetical protein n=1 Tax=Paraburkholderia aromaticivorans TaxID=2026199 RepID=UPI0038BC108A